VYWHAHHILMKYLVELSVFVASFHALFNPIICFKSSSEFRKIMKKFLAQIRARLKPEE
jgi:hypothetical protein